MNKNVETIIQNYSVKQLSGEDEEMFAANVMKEIRKQQIKPYRKFKSMYSRLSIIGSSVAAVFIAVLLLNTQSSSKSSADIDDLAADELLVIFENLGEHADVSAENNETILYEDIIFASELQEKL